MHLYQDATQGPHIDGQVIGHSQQHLWGTVEATLDVLVYLDTRHTRSGRENKKQNIRLLIYELPPDNFFCIILLLIRTTAAQYPLPQLARAAKVHYFDGTPLGVTEEDVLGLQVTVDDAELRRGQEE